MADNTNPPPESSSKDDEERKANTDDVVGTEAQNGGEGTSEVPGDAETSGASEHVMTAKEARKKSLGLRKVQKTGKTLGKALF